jgi:hypothetical protein
MIGCIVCVRAYFRFRFVFSDGILALVPATIELPDIALQIERNLARPAEILADPILEKLPNRIVMIAPPSVIHGSRPTLIANLLSHLLPEGVRVIACPCLPWTA